MLSHSFYHFSYLIFSRFIISSFQHLGITLPFAKLCYAFEEKIYNFMNKVILSCLIMNLIFKIKNLIIKIIKRSKIDFWYFLTYFIVSVCLYTNISQTLQANNSRILRIKNAKWYHFYMNWSIQKNFHICISVPLLLV